MSSERLSRESGSCYVDVPAILAGTALALAISLVFTNFGSAIGLSMTDESHWTGDTPWTGDTALSGVIATGLWVLWTQVTSSMAGGYIAGRMRHPIAGAASHEREIRDGAHGLLVWAVSTVAVAIGVGITVAFLAALDNTDGTTPAAAMTSSQHNAAIIFAFITAASSFVSAATSWWAATMGGEHRDNNTDHSHYVSFRKR